MAREAGRVTVEKVKEPCHVANSMCQNPAAWGGGAGYGINNFLIAIPLCFRCGYPVCEGENCSSVVEYDGGQRRLCATCLDEIENWNKRAV